MKTVYVIISSSNKGKLPWHMTDRYNLTLCTWNEKDMYTLCMHQFCMTPRFKLEWHLIIMRHGISTLVGDELWHKAPVSSITSISNVREETVWSILQSRTEELTKPLIATTLFPFSEVRGTKKNELVIVFDLGLKFTLQIRINHIFRTKKKIERMNSFLSRGKKKTF